MKGRDTFTAAEVNTLKKLIAEKQSASVHRQNSIRQKIRDLNFYYSDFGSLKEDYTVEEFEALIHSGAISILEGGLGSRRPDDIKGKEHLVDLLLEQFRQECLFEELEGRGVNLKRTCVNNLDIVLDMIGFPAKRSAGDSPEEENNPDDGTFSRSALKEKYVEAMHTFLHRQKVIITDNGLQIENSAGHKSVAKKLAHYIDWLYMEHSKLE